MCIITGDPHYITFDGTVITAQGSCMYVVSRTVKRVAETTSFASFYIHVRNIKRGTPTDKRATYPGSVFFAVNGFLFNVNNRLAITVGHSVL